MTTKLINVPANHLDDRTYTHHLIPHIIKESKTKPSPILVITDKELFAHGLIVASKETLTKCIHYNELNKFYFNLLKGSLRETLDLFEHLGLTNKILPYTSTEAFFFQTSQFVMRNALTVIKRVSGDDATITDLSKLLHNNCHYGSRMVGEFQRLHTKTAEESQKQSDIALWFFNDYFTGISGGRGATKTYDYASSVRTNLMNFSEEWSTVCGIDQHIKEEIIPTDADLITINLSTIKSNKSNIVTYLIHKLSQSIPNLTIYVDVSTIDTLDWETVLLNNRSVSTIIQISSDSKSMDVSLQFSTKRIQSFRGKLKVKASEIEEEMKLYYQKLNSKKEEVIEESIVDDELVCPEYVELPILDLGNEFDFEVTLSPPVGKSLEIKPEVSLDFDDL